MVQQTESEIIRELRETVLKQDAIIDQLKTPPNTFGVLMRVQKDRGVFVSPNGISEGQLPPGSNLRNGTFIKVNGLTGAIQEDDPGFHIGPMAYVRKLLGPNRAEIESESGRRVVAIHPNLCADLKENHRVELDPSGWVIMENHGTEVDTYSINDDISVSWNEIGGLEEAKMILREAVEQPHEAPELYEKYGHQPPRGILLFGPPGCGKTILAKATATALAKLHGRKSVGTGFIYVKGPEILSKWVGEAEMQVRLLFARAREHYAVNKYPAVIFLDEADAILGRRGEIHSADMERTIVPQFLSEMNGVNDRSTGDPLVLIATNRPDTLDPAVVRDERMDRRVEVKRPERDEVRSIFNINLRKKPLADNGLAEFATKLVFSPKNVLFRVEAKDGNNFEMYMYHAINGAMVAGIVKRATQLALRRELNGQKPKGLSEDDFSNAITENLKSMNALELRDELYQWATERTIEIDRVERVTY